MRLTVIDNRTLGVSVIQPASGLIWNWSASDWEAIAGAGPEHLQQLASMAGAPSPWNTVLTADLGNALNAPGACPIVWQLGTGGAPSAVVDWNTLCYPGPNPQFWNWPR